MGVMHLVKEQPVQRPGVQKACDYLKEWKTPHTFTLPFIHPPICSWPGSVLGTGPPRWGRSDSAKGTHSQGRETDNYHEGRNIHRCLREEREMGREAFLEDDIFEVWLEEELSKWRSILYRESSMCKVPVVMCSFMYSLYLFIQQICVECQPCVCTMHTGYKVNNNGAYIHCSVSLG